jgi:hypothetical protein
MTERNLIEKNVNILIDTAKPFINFMFKTTSTFMTSTTESNQFNIAQSYSNLQLRIFLIVFTCWSFLFVFIYNQYKFKLIKNYLIEITYRKLIIQLKIFKLITGILTQINNRIQVFDIWKISLFLRTTKKTINSINKFKGNVFFRINSVLCIIPKILRSFQAICATFSSINIRRILLLPFRIKKSFIACKNGIAEFWRTIEQIIQIIRLPIEFLTTIGSLLAGLVTLLKSFEKPRRPKLM